MSTIHDLIQTSEGYDRNKWDAQIPLGQVGFCEETCDLLIPNQSLFRQGAYVPVGLEKVALHQACTKLGPPPARYIEQCPAPLRAENLNYWADQLDTNSRKLDWLARCSTGPGGDTARAVLSTGYVPFGNTELLQTAADFIGDASHRLVRPALDRDRTYTKIIMLNNLGGGDYGYGVALSNNEIGQGKVSVTPLVQRISCDNSIAVIDKAWAMAHFRVGLSFLRGAVISVMGEAFKKAGPIIEKVVEAEVEQLPRFKDLVTDIANQFDLPDDVLNTVFMGTERRTTRMAAVNGFSYAARETEELDDAIQLEQIAGAVLYADVLSGKAVRSKVINVRASLDE